MIRIEKERVMEFWKYRPEGLVRMGFYMPMLRTVEGKPIEEVIPGYKSDGIWYNQQDAVENIANKGLPNSTQEQKRQAYSALAKIAKYHHSWMVRGPAETAIWNYRKYGDFNNPNDLDGKIKKLAEKGWAPKKVVDQLAKIPPGPGYALGGRWFDGIVPHCVTEMLRSYERYGDFRDTDVQRKRRRESEWAKSIEGVTLESEAVNRVGYDFANPNPFARKDALERLAAEGSADPKVIDDLKKIAAVTGSKLAYSMLAEWHARGDIRLEPEEISSAF
jgi:hypothetical protein